MRKMLTIFSATIISLIFSATLFGQDTASVNWSLQKTQSAVTSGSIQGFDETFDSLQVAYDASAVFDTLTLTDIQKFKPDGSGAWPIDTAKSVNRYVQFTVAPKTGFKLYITRLMMYLGAKGSNNIMASVYYSTDSSFSTATKVDTNMSLPQAGKGLAVLTFDNTINSMVDAGQKFYLRVYPWNSTGDNGSTSKYLYIQNVTIAGHTESVPTAASATWPLQTDLNPVTMGTLIADPPSYSYAMKFYGFTNLPTTDGYTVSTAAIQTVSKTWYAEPNPVDSLYFQFSTAPKFGGTFYTDNFSLFIGGWFTNNLRAAVYYSKDSTFTSKKVLIPDTALVGNKVQKIEAALKDTINSGEILYIRIYPHNTQAEGWAKLVALDSVIISGTTIGATADPPTLTTTAPANISTTFATSGGNISTDGGAPVTARGVVWDTAAAPTTAKNKTVDGTGSGTFVSQVTGLTAGTKYYLRAYASNDAGTAYGDEVTFTTLDSTVVPTVTTTTPSNILVNTAVSGGNVTAWGGDTVKSKGVCWNMTGNPTISDSKTVNGSGLGTFQSILYPLSENTTYYVRAYATNSIGTGYGQIDSFKTQIPAPPITKIVAPDGSGDYTSVQAAFNDVPDLYTGSYTIMVKNGTYKEKLSLGQNKVNVRLIGESRDSTILTYDDYAGKAGGTSNSYSASIDGQDFIAMNITFQNTVVNDGSVSDQQAVALETNGDRQAYYNCSILGYQDTYYARGAHGTDRIYMKNCYIEGSVDFIFGRDIVLFDSCEIHINRNGGTLTAASTDADSKFGYVFLNCIISADSVGFNGTPITDIYLGRPWQGAPRTVYMNTYEPAALDPAGWLAWNVPPALYAEYNCSGPGFADISKRASFSSQLTSQEAASYTLENIFSKESNPNFGYDWTPSRVITSIKDNNSVNQLPVTYQLYQNYPNPFNPSTTIKYSIPQSSLVKIVLYDILGREVKTLVNEVKNAGYYTIRFNASSLASGVYFYRIESGNFVQVKKMMLLK
jgi:pectin methylesterase-like acyl-CoA thioesterase